MYGLELKEIFFLPINIYATLTALDKSTSIHLRKVGFFLHFKRLPSFYFLLSKEYTFRQAKLMTNQPARIDRT